MSDPSLSSPSMRSDASSKAGHVSGPPHVRPQPAPPDEPAESRLVALLDPDSAGCLPRILSGPRSNALNSILERSVDILCARKPITNLVISTPVHDDGILAALAEAYEALYPSLSLKRLQRSPASTWSTLSRRDVNVASLKRTRRILIVDQFEEIFAPAVSDQARFDFVSNLAAMAQFPSTGVLLVVHEGSLELVSTLRALRPSLRPRFHLHLGTRPPLPTRQPQRLGAELPCSVASWRPELQPIRPKGRFDHLEDFRASA